MQWQLEVRNIVRFRLTNGSTREAVVYKVSPHGVVFFRFLDNGQTTLRTQSELPSLFQKGTIELVTVR